MIAEKNFEVLRLCFPYRKNPKIENGLFFLFSQSLNRDIENISRDTYFHTFYIRAIKSLSLFKKSYQEGIVQIFKSSHPEVFLGKGVLKICSNFTAEYPCLSVISIKLLCNSIEIALRHGYSPVNLLQIFKTPFLKNTSEGLLLSGTGVFL